MLERLLCRLCLAGELQESKEVRAMEGGGTLHSRRPGGVFIEFWIGLVAVDPVQVETPDFAR